MANKIGTDIPRQSEVVTRSIVEKFAAGRPVDLLPEEALQIRESLRDAIAVALDIDRDEIGEDVRIFDALGLDSIDVFDVMDQLAEAYEVQVALEELPQEMFRGAKEFTFAGFAEGLLAYFASPAQEIVSAEPQS